MGILDIFKFKKWEPDLEREPPPKKDWPDHVVTLRGKKFIKFIEKYPLSVIDFWAPWCEPCRKVTPRVRQLSKRYIGKVAFAKLNITDNKSIAKENHILGIPNLVFFSYGKKITNITGIRQIDVYQDTIDSILDKFNYGN